MYLLDNSYYFDICTVVCAAIGHIFCYVTEIKSLRFNTDIFILETDFVTKNVMIQDFVPTYTLSFMFCLHYFC